MPLKASSAAPRVDPSLVLEGRGASSAEPKAGLLERLASALDSEGVPYCQWKGHWTAHRWTTGRGDVDLLVAHDAMAEFRRIVGELGFKQALPSGGRQIPGVESYFGYDPAVPRLLHLHVHYRLVLGNYWNTVYRLPLERPMLETAIGADLFRVPSPTYQFLVFVLRTILMQRGRLLLSIGDRWRRGIQIQLDNLEALSDRETLAALLSNHLPSIDVPFIDRCVASLRGKHGMVDRTVLSHLLHHRLRAYARRPPLSALLNAAMEKIVPAGVLRRIADERMRPAGGGTVIALIGGDGAGKSTCARDLEEWLAANVTTVRAQMGNPHRSWLTFAVGGAVKAEKAINHLLGRKPRSVSHLELLRYLCTARDCFRLYAKIQRFAARGGIAVCDRYPVREIPSHVGPSIAALLPTSPTRLARLLQSVEVWYYGRIARPDMLVVLRLEPELAVARKPDEPADYVRERGQAVWETDWTASQAHVVDASRPLPEVLDDLKARIWPAL